MEKNSDRLYKLALLVIFVIAIVLIINYLTQSPIVIERENMDNVQMIMPQLQDWVVPPQFYYKNNYYYVNKQKQNPNAKPSFYFKDERYLTDKKFNPKLADPLNFDNDQQCGPKFDWSDPLNPGANNTYDDLLWNYMSPRMVLQDNCINCQNFKTTTTYNEPTGTTELKSTVNEPSGIASNLTSYYDGTMENGSLKDQKILDDSFLPANLATGNSYIPAEMVNKYISSPMTDGLPPLLNYESKCSV